MARERIIRNSAKCSRCLAEIESTYRHDFVTCPCGALSVDGGKDYLRRAYSEDAAWEDTSVVEELPDKEGT